MNLVSDFNSKVKNGEIQTIFKPCLCSSAKFTKVVDKDRYGLWHPVVCCNSCGLVQANPRLTDEEFTKFYSSDVYRSIYDGDDFLDASEIRYKNSNEIFNTLEPLMIERNFKKVIEFGCGGGWNLLPFKLNDYEVVGYDYSYGLTKLGTEKHDLDLRQGSFGDLKDESNYDVLIVNHVVEHFTDLESNIKDLISVLKPSGVMYIGVPTIDLVTRGQMQNAHTLYFTERTFCHYMEKFGLEVLEFGKVDTIHMYGIFQLSGSNSGISRIELENEFKLMPGKLFLGAVKIHIANLLDSLGIIEIVKKIIRWK